MAWVQLCSLQCGLSGPYAQALSELHPCLIDSLILDMPAFVFLIKFITIQQGKYSLTG